jgi:phage terminase large subunit-like protein
MPGLGDFTSIENVRDLHKQAKELASRENAFRQLYLCQLVDQAIRWLPVEHWRRCKVEMPDLRHAVAYGGLDISSVGDLTAYVIAIPDGRDWYVKAWCWIPVDTLERRAKDDPRWREWVKAGHVRLCEGNTIDPHQVTEEVISISKDYDVRGIALDMWQGLGAGRALERAGHRVSVWRPYWGHTTPPCKELERCVLQGRMKHDGHPVLEWCVDNVAVERDNFDNIRPIKPKHDPNVSSNPKIDLVVSMVMAMGLGMSDQGEATYNPFADGVSNIWL